MTHPRHPLRHALLPLLAFSLAALATLTAHAAERPVHLFILSGQSNMVHIDPAEVFTPTVTKAFPDADVRVAKYASSGKSILKWWQDLDPARPKMTHEGQLYKLLIEQVKKALGDKTPTTITFLWHQGEADARLGGAAYYEKAFRGMLGLLQRDLGDRTDINVVLARISDYGIVHPEGRADWAAIRELHVKMADADPYWTWVDTDDLNGDADGLHYPKAGYTTLGGRLAEQAIALVKKRVEAKGNAKAE